MAAFIDAPEANRIIEEESKRCIAALRAEQSRVGIKSRSGGLSKVSFKLGRKGPEGLYSKITLNFPRYGVFVHKGAGRGKGGEKGSKWVNGNNITIFTNPDSRGKMNTGKRRAKEWFNPVVEAFAERLTERLTKHFITIAFQRLNIK